LRLSAVTLFFTVDMETMTRILYREELCIYKEETALCVFAYWCGGGWETLGDVVKSVAGQAGLGFRV
jgi:hypothetical protein